MSAAIGMMISRLPSDERADGWARANVDEWINNLFILELPNQSRNFAGIHYCFVKNNDTNSDQNVIGIVCILQPRTNGNIISRKNTNEGNWHAEYVYQTRSWSSRGSPHVFFSNFIRMHNLHIRAKYVITITRTFYRWKKWYMPRNIADRVCLCWLKDALRGFRWRTHGDIQQLLTY